ncbi:MAG: hypothetical protein H7Y86_02515 [Rhizobacter sp.]|nr:hypothetical protein [Ferruginibacter sp.]
MKYILITFLLFFSAATRAQTKPAGATGHKDSLRNELQHLLQEPAGKINQVLACIDSASAGIKKIAADRSLSVPQKDDKVKKIAQARDKRISQLLTPKKVQQLQSFFQQRQPKHKKLLKKG